MTTTVNATFGALQAHGSILAPGTLYGRATFGAMRGYGVLNLARRRNAAAPTIGLPNASTPMVDPTTGLPSASEIQYRTNIAADLAKIKTLLGLT